MARNLAMTKQLQSGEGFVILDISSLGNQLKKRPEIVSWVRERSATSTWTVADGFIGCHLGVEAQKGPSTGRIGWEMLAHVAIEDSPSVTRNEARKVPGGRDPMLPRASCTSHCPANFLKAPQHSFSPPSTFLSTREATDPPSFLNFYNFSLRITAPIGSVVSRFTPRPSQKPSPCRQNNRRHGRTHQEQAARPRCSVRPRLAATA
jgi:hypothetical protein